MDAATLRLEMESELTRILDYWMTHAPDMELGGYQGELDHTNLPNPGATKGAILHARILWTFSAAYRTNHSKPCLDQARRAYDYLRDHFLDREYGGVYWELEADGSVRNPRKQIYALAFALYGFSEYHLATGDSEALQIAKDLFLVIEKHSFDSVHNGYLEALSRQWGVLEDVRLSDKDENALKTMNTHLHVLEAYTNLYRAWKDERLKQAQTNLIHVFLDRIVQSDFHFGLFFDDRWNLSSRNVSPGHDIEGSWLLYEAAEVLGDATLIARVREVSIAMAEATKVSGISPAGAVREELHVATGDRDPSFHWWPQAEGVVGFFNAWQLSGNPEFLELAFRIWTFARDHLFDREHGEWFWKVNAEGIPVLSEPKVAFWKCPYHNGRACMEVMHRIHV